MTKQQLLKKTVVALIAILAIDLPAYSENKVDFRIEGDVGGQYNSNIAQIAGFGGDFINSYTVTGTARYLAPSQTQLLARVQGQLNKFISRNEFDVAVFAGSLTLSQWFFNTLNIYAGIQPIQLVSLSSTRKPLDMVYLGGLTYYYPFNKDIAFAGYQIDKLNASAQDFSSINNTFFLGIRHSFTDNLFLNATGRVRLRNLDVPTIADDTRYTGALNAQYIFNPWLTLQAGGDYTQITSTASERNIGVFSFGVNIIGGYNSSLSF